MRRIAKKKEPFRSLMLLGFLLFLLGAEILVNHRSVIRLWGCHLLVEQHVRRHVLARGNLRENRLPELLLRVKHSSVRIVNLLHDRHVVLALQILFSHQILAEKLILCELRSWEPFVLLLLLLEHQSLLERNVLLREVLEFAEQVSEH